MLLQRELSYIGIEALHFQNIENFAASTEFEDGIDKDLALWLGLPKPLLDPDDYLDFSDFPFWIVSAVVWRAPDGVRDSSAGEYCGFEK